MAAGAEPLAIVNGQPISQAEFEEAAARKTAANGDMLSDAEKQEVIDSLIADRLLYAEALRLGLDQDPRVKKVMVNMLLRNEVYDHVKGSDFTDKELESWYNSHKSEFVVPEKVQIKRIEIKVTDERTDANARAECERIRRELLKAPDSFGDLASKFSEDVYRRRGGDVGFVSREGKPGLDPAIVEAAFALKTGDLSRVMRVGEGYSVITVASRREQVERTFQQMKGSVLRKVKNDRMKGLYDQYVAGILAHADVRINTPAIHALPIRGGTRPATPGDEEIDEPDVAP